MGKVYNLIPEASHQLKRSAADWSIVSGTGTFAAQTDVVLFDDVGALRISPTSATVRVSTTPTLVPAEDLGWRLRGSAWLYAAGARTVTLRVTRTSGGATETTETSMALYPDRWMLIACDGPATLDGVANLASMSLETNGETFVAWPALTLPDTALRNLFASEAWLRLPDYIKDADAAQTQPIGPLFRFMEVLFSEAEVLMDEWINARYLPPDRYWPFDNGSLSLLVHPQVCPVERLNWLGQFVGVRIAAKQTTYTSWGDLEREMQEWSEWQTVPDTQGVGNNDATVSWTELENFNSVSSGVDTTLRWQVSSGSWGLHAGTNAALIDTARQYLSGTKTVTVTPRYGGDPWRIVVRTKASESPDGVVLNGSSPTLVEALTRAAPVGFEIVHIASL